MGGLIDVKTLEGDASFKAYLAEPSGTPRAAIVVIQEIFGVNPGIRKMADDWAAKGYLAIAPDLFWRVEPGVELDADVPEQFQKGIDLMLKLDFDVTIRDLEAVIREARRRVDGGKVGAVGYCMGGHLAFLVATRTDADAIVSYYGGGIDSRLGEAHAIGKPVTLHLAVEDKFIPAEAQARIHEALDGNRHVTIHDYPGQDHAFARAYGSARNEEAANLADGRTAAFFAEHLA